MTSYAYVHCTPEGVPFYVGAGGKARVRVFSRQRDCPPYEAVAQYVGRDRILVGALECSSKEAAYELEQGLIKRLRLQGVELCNRTDGGAGITGPRPEHSKIMRERGHWAGERHPFFGNGARQEGAKNPAARCVRGVHSEHGERVWDTLKAASETLGVSVQAISQAIRKGQRSKGWKMEHADDD